MRSLLAFALLLGGCVGSLTSDSGSGLDGAAAPIDMATVVPVDLSVNPEPDIAAERDMSLSPAPDLSVAPDLAMPPGNCADGVKDGLETDVDCGGPQCPACGWSRACSVAKDCSTGSCASGHCAVKPIAFTLSATLPQVQNYVGVAVTSGDFNGDGKADVATSSSAYLGHGDGTFGQPIGFAGVGDGDIAMTAADLNGDKKTDIAGANGQLVVNLGNGDGTFQATKTTQVMARSATAVDLDGDGKLDLIVPTESSVAVLLGKGDGTFGQAMYQVSGHDLEIAASGDFNHDGKPDFAVADAVIDGQILVALGKGDGTFADAVAYGAATGYATVATADLDRDGKLDLLATSPTGGGTLYSWLGKGDGTFKAPVSLVINNKSPARMHVADFNGDGAPDALAIDAGTQNGQFTVMPGHGDGTFDPAIVIAAQAGNPTDFTVADFNGDGRPDTAMATYQSGTAIFLNTSQ